MRVLVSAYEVDPAAGGEAGFGWHTGWLLAERGLDVHVVTHERSRADIERVGVLPTGLHFHFVSPGRPIAGFRSGQRGVYANYLLWQRACLKRARELHENLAIDVIHHVSWASLFWGSRLWRIGVPFVFGPGGGAQTSPKILAPQFGKAWRRERLRNSALRFGLRLNPLARRTITHASAFLVTNRETFAAVTRFGAHHTELLLDVALPASSILEDERQFPGTQAPIVLWVGRDLPLKGIPLALTTFAQVRKELPKARLVMIGSLNDSERVQHAVSEAGLVGVVEFPGFVPHNRLSEWFDQASVLLFSSLRESAGVPPFEAMSRGLPVVGLDRSGLRDFAASDAVARIPVGPAEEMVPALARAVVRFASDERAWRSASKAAVDCARLHTWDQRVSQFVSVYALVTDKGRLRDDRRMASDGNG